MKEGVEFIKNILREVAKEKGMSFDELYELWRLHLEYLKHNMDKEDCFAINLPHLGHLYYNAAYELSASRLPEKEIPKNIKIRELIQEDIDNFKGVSKTVYPQKRHPSFLRYVKTIYRKVFDYRKSYHNKKKAIEVLELYSNNELTKEFFNEQNSKHNKV